MACLVPVAYRDFQEEENKVHCGARKPVTSPIVLMTCFTWMPTIVIMGLMALASRRPPRKWLIAGSGSG